jgi:hypothetical protein
MIEDSKLVFPEPTSPIMHTNSPLFISRSIFFKVSLDPTFFALASSFFSSLSSLTSGVSSFFLSEQHEKALAQGSESY